MGEQAESQILQGKATNSSAPGDRLQDRNRPSEEKFLKKRIRQRESPQKKEEEKKRKCKSGDVERRERITNCRMDRELAKMMTMLTALEQFFIICRLTCFF